MSVLSIDRFRGMNLVATESVLPNGVAVDAQNLVTRGGDLIALRQSPSVASLTLGSGTKSIHRYDRDGESFWMQWTDDGVSVALGPIADDAHDRVYWTGEDYPRVASHAKLTAGSGAYPRSSWRLGVPAPSGVPHATRQGTFDPDGSVREAVYVFTYVSDLGEEGPPSAHSNVVQVNESATVDVTLPVPVLTGQSADSTLANRPFTVANAKKRLYRANAGSTSAAFQFVAETAWSATTHRDATRSYALGEVLPSERWYGPPDDDSTLFPGGPLEGLIALPNGVFAGFSGQGVHFSEPYLPHAWSPLNRVGIDRPVVALGLTGAGLVVLTESHPYLIVGAEPGALSAQRIMFPQGCLGRDTVVDMGGRLMYMAPDGLAEIDGAGGRILTYDTISPEDWRDRYKPGEINAFFWEGAYIAVVREGSAEGVGFIYDPTGRTVEGLVDLPAGNHNHVGGWSDPSDGNAYMIEGTRVERFGTSGARQTAIWESQTLRRPMRPAFAFMLINFADDLNINDTVRATVTADGSADVFTLNRVGPTSVSLVRSGHTARTLRHPFVVPLAPRRAAHWKVKLTTNTAIQSVHLAEDALELGPLIG